MGRKKKVQPISFDNSEEKMVPKIEGLPDEKKPDIDEELNKLLNEFQEEKQEAEKKTSKYYREKKAKEIEENKIKEAISGIGSTALSLIIERMPNPKPLSDKEAEQFDTVFDKLSQKYFSLLGKWQEESAFIIVLAFIIIPRTTLLNKKEIEQADSKKENEETKD